MKIIKRTITILSLTICLTAPLLVLSQVPPPPPPDHNSQGNVPGGGAPIGGGLLILIGLGGIYGGIKLYKEKKKSLLD